jgi:hypothetical protein
VTTPDTKPIQERLLAEYERRRKAGGKERLSMAAILAKSGLDIDRSTLHRLLHGDGRSMTLDEAVAIGRVLGKRVQVRGSVSITISAAA